MQESKLYLKIPSVDELGYYRKLISDPDTMSYNRGWGEDENGCYYLSEEEAIKWHKRWVNVPQRYFAYLVRKTDDLPIGYVNIYYDNNYEGYMIGIVIEAQFRGNGYASEGCSLVAEIAFYQMGVSEIADDFPPERISAEKAFSKIGFKRKSANLMVLSKEDFEAFSLNYHA